MVIFKWGEAPQISSIWPFVPIAKIEKMFWWLMMYTFFQRTLDNIDNPSRHNWWLLNPLNIHEMNLYLTFFMETLPYFPKIAKKFEPPSVKSIPGEKCNEFFL